jgi:hypothetical protein
MDKKMVDDSSVTWTCTALASAVGWGSRKLPADRMLYIYRDASVRRRKEYHGIKDPKTRYGMGVKMGAEPKVRCGEPNGKER